MRLLIVETRINSDFSLNQSIYLMDNQVLSIEPLSLLYCILFMSCLLQSVPRKYDQTNRTTLSYVAFINRASHQWCRQELGCYEPPKHRLWCQTSHWSAILWPLYSKPHEALAIQGRPQSSPQAHDRCSVQGWREVVHSGGDIINVLTKK